jgi:hypothetical protein
MEIANLIHEIEERGAILWLKENGAIGLRGKQSIVAAAVEHIEPWRHDVKAYLKKRQAAPIESETEAEVKVVEPPRFTNCPTCGMLLQAPSIDVAIENFRKYQRAQGTYWIWNDVQMERLRQAMKPGDVIEYPTFAMSCRIRRPDGLLYVHERGESA